MSQSHATHEIDRMRLMLRSYPVHPTLPYFIAMLSFKTLRNIRKAIFSRGIKTERWEKMG